MTAFIVGLGLISVAHALIEYQTLIPNGVSVPDPCSSGIWRLVGHYNPTKHTTKKNPFGLAFADAGRNWTTTLCRADSDDDGASNGEELGDPNCVWTVGAIPARAATGHPGICEPLGSTRCANEVYKCGCKGRNCAKNLLI